MMLLKNLSPNSKSALDEIGGSPGTRTPNQLIKSQLLYH